MKTKNTKRNLVMLFGLLLIGLIAMTVTSSKKEQLNQTPQIASVKSHHLSIYNTKCGDGKAKDAKKTMKSKCGDGKVKDAKKTMLSKCGDAKAKDAKKTMESKCGDAKVKDTKKTMLSKCGDGKAKDAKKAKKEAKCGTGKCGKA